MPWLIDGSNVLGAMRLDRHDDGSKRALIRHLAAFARSARTRVSCVFDGPEPASFGSHLGSVTVTFSGARAADDLIAERAAQGRGWSVVTSDRGLAARVQRRHVEVIAAGDFVRRMEQIAAADPAMEGDWESWFADPSNREKF
jgi:rRNA-processing protein FCF1